MATASRCCTVVGLCCWSKVFCSLVVKNKPERTEIAQNIIKCYHILQQLQSLWSLLKINLIKAVLTSVWKVGYRKIGRLVLFNLHWLHQSLDYRCAYYSVLSEI